MSLSCGGRGARRPARRAISSVVERAPDNCVVVPGLRIDGAIQVRSNVDPTFYSLRGIRAVRRGPPRLLSSRESIHPLSVYGQLSLERRFRDRTVRAFFSCFSQGSGESCNQ
uniref:Uncharacterized protein ycf68 n=1 Tax=Brassica oleracea TaxID=3712 RepID=A0A3P6H2H7_BRAOL|nr:unnamed protein product [Brassica oleracea]